MVMIGMSIFYGILSAGIGASVFYDLHSSTATSLLQKDPLWEAIGLFLCISLGLFSIIAAIEKTQNSTG
jgi:hypothetical protein